MWLYMSSDHLISLTKLMANFIHEQFWTLLSNFGFEVMYLVSECNSIVSLMFLIKS